MTIETLKTELWEKVIGNTTITQHNHYYEEIKEAIRQETGYSLSRDTIRNFIEGRNKPSPRTLDIYATFILGGTQDAPKTFQDFREWWEQQHTESGHQESDKKGNVFRYGLATATLVFVFLIGTIMIKWLQSNKEGANIIWVEEFNTNSPDQLQQRGWRFIDFDSTYWNQTRDSCLTLFTQYGEYTSNLIDSTVHNLVYKKLDCKCCEITVKIVDFNPYNRFQQASLFLLDTNLSRKNNFRFAFITMHPDTIFEKRVPEYQVHNKRGIQVFNQVNNQTKHFTDQLSVQIYRLGEIPTPEENIWLKVEFDHDAYRTFYKTNESSTNFVPYAKDDLHFIPEYIGLACLGNGVKAKTNPNSDDDIPAYFDYVVVKECD